MKTVETVVGPLSRRIMRNASAAVGKDDDEMTLSTPQGRTNLRGSPYSNAEIVGELAFGLFFLCLVVVTVRRCCGELRTALCPRVDEAEPPSRAPTVCQYHAAGVPSSSSSSSEDCCICLEGMFGTRTKTLLCRHEFHAACIDQWLTTTVNGASSKCAHAPSVNRSSQGLAIAKN